jgi:hypothetical protein
MCFLWGTKWIFILFRRNSVLTWSLYWQMSCVYFSILLFIVVKWQSAYGVHKVQMPLPGRCVSACALVLNYGATNVAPTQKDQPLLSSNRRPHFQTHKQSWNEQKFGQGRLCWRGPATIYWTWTWVFKGLIMTDFVWDSRWMKWHWSRLFSEFLCCSPPNHQPIPAPYSSITASSGMR